MNAVSLPVTACLHCGTPIVQSQHQASEQFCCAGCEFVFGLMQTNGLQNFYALRDLNPPACPIPTNIELVDSVETAFSIETEKLKVRFYLDGINCTACVWLLEKLPDYCTDVESARVDIAEGTIEVVRKSTGSFSRIAHRLSQFGYRPHLLRDDETAIGLQIRERRKNLIRIGVAGAATGNIMILAVSIYSGANGTLGQQFQWLTALLALPVLTFCAWPFYVSAYSAIRMRHLNLDVPIVIAIGAGIITSCNALIHHTGAIYFDSLSMLVFLLLGSRFLLKSIQDRHLRALNIEDDLLSSTVCRIGHENKSENVNSTLLSSGDLIEINSGQLVPIDGFVESGTGSISRAILTGESEAIPISIGMLIEAGSQKIYGDWRLRVLNTPGKTRLAKVLRDTEAAAANKSKIVQFSDVAAQYFIGFVLLAAVAIVLFHIESQPAEGFSRALALVIVTCPCVFGIAIPLSMGFAIRNAARNGIIIKNSDAIEKIWDAKSIFFDKTATLTTGEMAVTKADASSPLDHRIALSLEKNQRHPVARALNNYFSAKKIVDVSMEQVTVLPDGGVSGSFAGNRYAIRSFTNTPEGDPTSPSAVRSSIGLFKNDELTSTYVLCDQTRNEARDILEWFRAKHFTPCLLSGDRKAIVESFAQDLGFAATSTFSGMSAENKAVVIRRSGPGTVMIGDGANDAPALAAASVGIAMHGSLDTSLRTADIYLTRPHLEGIRELFEIAWTAKRAIRRNLFFSAGFNIIAGLLAAVGLMTPLWAAVFMPLSSSIVLLSALASGRQRRSQERFL